MKDPDVEIWEKDMADEGIQPPQIQPEQIQPQLHVQFQPMNNIFNQTPQYQINWDALTQQYRIEFMTPPIRGRNGD
jgi:hypothetical protein